MHEIWTRAKLPYTDMANNQQVWVQVVSGYRLPCPEDCPKVAHEIMMECWRQDPKERPVATEVAKKIRLLQSLCPVPVDESIEDIVGNASIPNTPTHVAKEVDPAMTSWIVSASSVPSVAVHVTGLGSPIFSASALDVSLVHGSLPVNRPTSYQEADAIFSFVSVAGNSNYHKLTQNSGPVITVNHAAYPSSSGVSAGASDSNLLPLTINRLSSYADKHHYVGVNRKGDIESEI
jgi:hypothetical protein